MISSLLPLLSALLQIIVICATPDERYANERDGTVLSRRKRYLIFPEGSSLQLVYCLTVPSIGMGQIFTIGGTAALAWELPHTPYRPLKKSGEDAEQKKRVDKFDVSTSGGGWTLNNPYYPAINKYTKTYAWTPIQNSTNNYNYRTIFYHNKKPYSPYQWKTARKNENYRTINDQSDFGHYHELHRKTRRDLYGKIQKFLTAQNKDGKACVLKAICEVSGATIDGVGTFMEEIMKAIFRIKPHENYEDEDEFDAAYNKKHSCMDRYPTCKSSIWNIF